VCSSDLAILASYDRTDRECTDVLDSRIHFLTLVVTAVSRKEPFQFFRRCVADDDQKVVARQPRDHLVVPFPAAMTSAGCLDALALVREGVEAGLVKHENRHAGLIHLADD